MRKTFVVLLSVLLVTLASMPMIRPAQAHINQWTWLPPYIDKVNGSYVIYKHGSTVQFKVPVENDLYANGLNVSKVVISFDWGGASSNKTLDLSASPVQIGWNEIYTFTVSFVANATEAISSAWQHTYTVYVEHVNATGGSVTPPLSRDWDFFGGANKWKFIVYSTDQADALDLQTKYNSYVSSYPLSYFTDTDARQLAGQAQIEGAMASSDYADRQDYASAKSRYQTALNLYSQALTAEKNYQATLQNATLNTTLTANEAALINAKANQTRANATLVEANAAVITANATKIQAEAALTKAYGFYFIGLGFALGWSFIGIGVIIYALRKPKSPPA